MVRYGGMVVWYSNKKARMVRGMCQWYGMVCYAME